MAKNNEKSESVEVLCENPDDVFLDACGLLLRFSQNILNNPGEQKYRKIRVENAIVQKRIFPVPGALECLFEMGFEDSEDGESFIFPTHKLLDDMQNIKKLLLEEKGKRENCSAQGKTSQPTTQPPQAAVPSITSGRTPSQTSSAQPARNLGIWGPATQQMVAKEVLFYKKIESSLNQVQIYENPNLQDKARRTIPVERLKQSARDKLKSLPPDAAKEVSFEDLLLLQLLAWFKQEFFSWVNSPECDMCNGNTRAVGMVEPSAEDRLYGAGRVENYHCSTCGSYTRFPRYNDPGKLLESRKGRCGEWANCFTLCCRAMGFESRYVLDWTDHVWTEVYSQKQKRWMHADSCENTCDKPLTYEQGWGKKLSYVLAFSKDDVQDVSWRYSIKHNELLSRRNECRENWLVNVIVNINKKKWSSFSETKRQEMMQRLITELIEFMTIKSAKSGELGGRVSGSLAWRQARGEIGSPAASSATEITASENEKKNKLIHIKYCSASDKYIRVSDGNKEIHNWGSMVHEFHNITRKVENDWNKSYLARTPGTDTAKITWKFDFSGSSLVVDRLNIKCESECFESGRISWRLCAGEQCARLPADGSATEVDYLSGSTEVTLTGELQGGQGDVAWQHTQLFRQKADDFNTFPLEIKIFLK